jgi:hypothetical protein
MFAHMLYGRVPIATGAAQARVASHRKALKARAKAEGRAELSPDERLECRKIGGTGVGLDSFFAPLKVLNSRLKMSTAATAAVAAPASPASVGKSDHGGGDLGGGEMVVDAVYRMKAAMQRMVAAWGNDTLAGEVELSEAKELEPRLLSITSYLRDPLRSLRDLVCITFQFFKFSM